MDLLSHLPDELSNELWSQIDKPILTVNVATGLVKSANNAAMNAFGIRGNLMGVRWPGMLTLIRVPDDQDISYLSVDKFDTTTSGSITHKLQFQDSSTFEDRFINIQVIRPLHDRDGMAAIVLNEYTVEHQIQESRSDFVALASHQLRTPISAARWSLEIFISRYKNQLNDDQNHIIENTSKSIEKMNSLVSALLSVSRIETGRLEINPEKFSIDELIRLVISDVEDEAKKKNIKLLVDVHQNLPEIFLDKSLTKFLFSNLLMNAIKYSNDGGEVSLFLSRKNNILIVRIADKGMGIPKAEQKKIFKKFFRSEIAQKRDPSGSGLGLYLAKMIVEKSGGKIWFESQEAKGTTVWFTLPTITKEE